MSVSLNPKLGNLIGKLDLSEEKQGNIARCVTRYTLPETFSEGLAYVAFRVWNSIKSIFGQSDWQVAVNLLEKKINNLTPERLKEIKKKIISPETPGNSTHLTSQQISRIASVTIILALVAMNGKKAQEQMEKFISEDRSLFATAIKYIVKDTESRGAGPEEIVLEAREKRKTAIPVVFPEPAKRKENMDVVFGIYAEGCCPQVNRKNLGKYIQSDDYLRHCSTAKVYYNNKEMMPEDALVVMSHREPSNIAMSQLYDKRKLKMEFGHSESAYNDDGLVKSNGSYFWETPNTASVYSETYLWSPPGEKAKKEIACLSVPAPSLDTSEQPHWAYYMDQQDNLDLKKYRKEMEHLAETIMKAAIENKDTAFGGKGIKRLIIPRYGQGAFLGGVSHEDSKEATKIFYDTLVKAVLKHKDSLGKLKIALSLYSPHSNREATKKFVSLLENEGVNAAIVNGDIVDAAEENDLIVNAWDPHSAPGNGCDSDGSFDGAMGMATGIPITQIPWLNLHLKNLANYIGVH